MKKSCLLLRTFILLFILPLAASCNGQTQETKNSDSVESNKTIIASGETILSIYQDYKGDYCYSSYFSLIIEQPVSDEKTLLASMTIIC